MKMLPVVEENTTINFNTVKENIRPITQAYKNLESYLDNLKQTKNNFSAQ